MSNTAIIRPATIRTHTQLTHNYKQAQSLATIASELRALFSCFHVPTHIVAGLGATTTYLCRMRQNGGQLPNDYISIHYWIHTTFDSNAFIRDACCLHRCCCCWTPILHLLQRNLLVWRLLQLLPPLRLLPPVSDCCSAWRRTNEWIATNSFSRCLAFGEEAWGLRIVVLR